MKRIRVHMRLKDRLMALLLVAGLALLYVAAKRYPFYYDLSATQHALSPTTVSLLEQFPQGLQVKLYSDNPEIYHRTQLLIERFQRYSSQIQFSWQHQLYLNTNQHETHALELRYKDSEHVLTVNDDIDEGKLISALFHLQRKANRWIVFLQGHHEPSPFGNSNRDFGLWRQSLQNQGLKIQALDLNTMPVIADNAQLIVIASPHSAYSLQEQSLILQYVRQGGDLLWLVDPNSDKLNFLAQELGVEVLPGTVMDLQGQKLGTPHPAITIVQEYTKLPFQAPPTVMALPFACALTVQATSIWQSQALLLSNEFSWTETQVSSQRMAFEPELGEVAGPLTLGLSLTRVHPSKPDVQQRLAIIGNSRFLSNGAIENYGNLAFGMNLMNWLTQADTLLQIQQPTAPDTLLTIRLPTAMLIQYGFPALATIAAISLVSVHVRRRRKSQQMTTLLSRSN